MNEYAFRAGQLDLYGAVCKVRGKRGMVLNANVLLAAETAADKLVFNIYLFHGQAKHGGCLVLSIVYALVGRIYLHPAVPRQCHGALRFKEGVLRKGRCVFAVQYVLALRYRARRVPAGNMLMRKQIAAFVQLLRALGHCLVCIAYGRKLLVINAYKRLCGLHSLRRFAHHKRHCIAQVARAVALGYHCVPVLFKVTYLVLPGYVLGGKYGNYAIGRFRLFGIYFQYARAGVFGAQGACVCHAIDIHIVRIFAVPKHLFAHVKARHPAAHGPRLILRGYCALPHKPCRKPHGVYYFNVARAAAYVALQRTAYFILTRVAHLIQQRLRRHYHARRAEAALHRARVAEGIYIRFLFKCAQPFGGYYMLAVQPVRALHAGLHCAAVYYNGACAARALAAPVLYGGQPQLIPEIAKQGHAAFALYNISVHIEAAHAPLLLLFRYRYLQHIAVVAYNGEYYRLNVPIKLIGLGQANLAHLAVQPKLYCFALFIN